jgi:hypothetical protein
MDDGGSEIPLLRPSYIVLFTSLVSRNDGGLDIAIPVEHVVQHRLQA